MNFQFLKYKKIFGLVLGLVVLVGSGVVVGLTVVRIQNQKATIDQPKAMGGGGCTTSTNNPCLHKTGDVFDCCNNCDAGSQSYNSSTGYCSVACGGGQCFYDKGGGNWVTSPNSCNTQSCTVIGSIQGIKYLMPGNQNLEPAISQTVTLDGKTSQTKNPYFFGNIVTGTHTVSVTVPTGYTVGYTLCYSNQDQCGAAYDPKGYHNVTPTSGNSVTVNVPNVASGYADLWWHFTVGTSCPAGQTLCSGSCFDTNTSTANCGTCGHVCTIGQVCQIGVCTTVSQTHLACQNNACAAVAGAGNNLDGCLTAGQNCSTACTVDSQCPGQVCAEGTCVNPTQSHLGCLTNSCVRKIGTGNNTEGCTTLGGQCQTSQSRVTIFGCKKLGQSFCWDATNAQLTLNSFPVMLDGVATTEINPSDPLSNSFVFRASPGNHVVSVQVPVGYTTSYSLCDDACLLNPNITPNYVQGNSVAVTVINNSFSQNSIIWRFEPSGSTLTPTPTPTPTPISVDEVSACWGNGGTNGACYDSNGDGQINSLDFAFMRLVYSKKVI